MQTGHTPCGFTVIIPLKYSVFGQILEFNPHNSKLKNMSSHVMCFQVTRIEFQWQSCNYLAIVGLVVVSGHVKPIETVGFTLLALFHLLFFSTTALFTLKVSHTHISLYSSTFYLPSFTFLPLKNLVHLKL